jgi:hypothetical protein
MTWRNTVSGECVLVIKSLPRHLDRNPIDAQVSVACLQRIPWGDA